MKLALFRVAFAMSVAACGFFPHESEDGGVVDAPGRDAPGRDAGPGIDAPALDAGIDAPPIDAPPVDAPPIDAGVPPGEPFTVTLDPPPIVPRFTIGFPVVEMAKVTNNLARRLNVDFTFTGGFNNAGRCTNIEPQATCTLFANVDIATLGVRTGSLALAGGGLRKTVPITATVQPFVEGRVAAGQGAVTLSPAQSPGCIPIGGCYAEGTQVTATAVPAPSFVFAGWDNPLCGASPTCTVTAGFAPISLGATFAPQQLAVEIEITGSLGEVRVVDSSFGGGSCIASCTLMVAAGPLTVSLSTPGYVASVDGQATHTSGGLTKEYPNGATSIAVTFTGDPGEVQLVADDVELGPGGVIALRVGGTITVYNAAMVAQWTAPGSKMAFTASGELYIQDGASHTTKYAASGSVLVAADTALGFVRPGGGLLVPGPAIDQFTVRDAQLAVVLTPTMTGKFGGLYGGCLAEDDHQIFATAGHPADGEITLNTFDLTGHLIAQRERNWFDCHTRLDYHGAYTIATFHPGEITAGNRVFTVDDLTTFADPMPFDAASDAADNLYWTYAPSADLLGPVFSLLKKYTPPGTVPVWTIARAPDVLSNQYGIRPIKIVAGPDGRLGWLVTWFHADSTQSRAVLMFPPSFTGPSASRRSSRPGPGSPRR